MAYSEKSQIKPDVFENPFLSLQLKALRVLGFITGTNQKYQLWHFIRGVFVAISFILSVIILLVRVIRYVHIIEADFMLRPVTFMEISYTIHIVNAFLQRGRIARLSNFIHEELLGIRSSGDDLEKQLLEKYVKYVRRITYIFVIPSVFNGYSTLVDCLIQSVLQPDVIYDQVLAPQKLNGTVKPILLFQSYPVGEVLNNFVIGYVGSFYAMMLNCTFIPFLHTLSACVFMFAVFKYQILSKHMRDMDILKIFPHLKLKIEHNQLCEVEKNALRLKMSEYCAMEQIKIRWFIDELEQLLRVPVFSDFFIFSVIICVLLYSLLIGNLTMLEYSFAIIFIMTMVAFQLLYHYHSTLLTKTHEELCLAIYSNDWYNYPVQVQKHFLLNMVNTSQPLIVMAFIVPLRLQTVLDISKGAFSYYSILKNLAKEN